MKLLRRILFGFVMVVAAICWIAPAGFVYLAKTAPAVTRVVPTELHDVSTSSALGKKLSYFGYDLEVPWSDLDESHTRVVEDKPDIKMVWICFKSGLKLFAVFTPNNAKYPDYETSKRIYDVTPDQVHYWSLIEGRDHAEVLLLQLKASLLLEVGDPRGGSSPAETGIFNLRSKAYRGFQFGDPRSRPDTLQLRVYSDDGKVEIKVLQGGYDEPSGVSQPEINRIVQSLRKTASDSPKSLAVNSN